MARPGTGNAFARVLAERWSVARLLPRAGAPLVGLLILINVVLGALPVVFIVATGVLLGRLPTVAADHGPAGWAVVGTPFAVAAVAFAGQQVLAPLQSAAGELVARRIDGYVAIRVMAAALADPQVTTLEDPVQRNRLAEAGRELLEGFASPGRACAALPALLARYVQLSGCVLVVGMAFNGLAAAGVLVTTLMFRYGQRSGLRRYSSVFGEVADLQRRSSYLRDLAMLGHAAQEIRLFGLIGWLRDRYQASYLDWIRPVWAARRRIYLRPFLGYTTAGAVLMAMLLGWLGWTAGHRLDLTALAITVQATLSALRLGDFYPEADLQTQYGMNAYQALIAFEADTTTAPADRLRPAPVPLAPPRTAIRFAGVSFRYPGRDQPVLDGLELTIPAGRCTAIVGVNGAGKSTLIKLLARLYAPTDGLITIDGTDIASIDIGSLRAGMGIVFQDFLRYELPAADNIGFGRLEQLGDRAGIRAAAEAAQLAQTFDAMPHGLDTPLARHLPHGRDLSGGQWQRIALARALFALRHGASILVLDEPTASLDIRAEARFFDDFRQLTHAATTILVSHRFSTVRHADHIVVLDSGRVSEQGAHDELIEAQGRYARMFQLQAERFTTAAGAAAPAERTPGSTVAPT